MISFQTNFPQQFGVPNVADSKVDFTLLKTYTMWNSGDGHTGMRYVLTKGFAEQKRSLQAHMKVQLGEGSVALALASQTLLDVT